MPTRGILSPLALWIYLLTATNCNKMNYVDADAARPVAAAYWQALQNGDVSKAVEMYDAHVWSVDPDARDRWSDFLGDLGKQFGAVTSADMQATKWFPGSSLVPDHRPFVCYAYDYEIKRPGLTSRERLIICGEPKAAATDLRIYGHELQRTDTGQSLRIGVGFRTKAVP